MTLLEMNPVSSDMKCIDACRLCGSEQLEPVLDLGNMPLADDMPMESELGEPQSVFPLTVLFCGSCSLMQIRETVDPEVLFGRDYPYFSSFSEGMTKNARELTHRLVKAKGLNSESLVIEPASNDGYLLINYVELGIPVLGIDPVPNPAAAAMKRGVNTLQTFFTPELAKRLAASGQKADVIHANNVLAHQSDLNGFVQGISQVLKPDGTAVLEMPYVRDLIEHCEFDTIYHEHLCYFSLTALAQLFAAHGLYINDVEKLEIHGGSLRIFAEKTEQPVASVKKMLADEQDLGIDRFDYYKSFGKRVETLRSDLLNLLNRLKAEGSTIAAYGAAAKGSTLINFAGIGKETLDFVVDRNTHKHGRVMPGQHVPIRETAELVNLRPGLRTDVGLELCG